jgi:hypothetical protein
MVAGIHPLPLHHLDLLLRQPVQLVDDLVDQPIGAVEAVQTCYGCGNPGRMLNSPDSGKSLAENEVF